MKPKSRLIPIWLPEPCIENLDKLVSKNIYPTRSEAIRDSIRIMLKIKGEPQK